MYIYTINYINQGRDGCTSPLPTTDTRAHMLWDDGYIAVDWGTTNRRAYRIGTDRAVVDGFEDTLGLKSIAAGGFDAAAADIRARLGDLPMLLAGMVGSKTGWRETAYVDCPAGPDAIAANILWLEPGRTGIIPGVCQRSASRPDVMRGEEVQILGALAAKMIPPDALVCHPGTHSKWIHVAAGQIAQFQTMMTGELFDLIRSHSILAGLMTGDVQAGPAFWAGVNDALGGQSILTGLFGIRARALLAGDDGDSASRASGLLIGADIMAGARKHGGQPLFLIGRPDLSALYDVAAGLAGYKAVQIDATAAFLAGVYAIKEATA